MTPFTDRYSPITKRFPLRLNGHVQEVANTTREGREKILVSLNWGIVCQTRPYKLEQEAKIQKVSAEVELRKPAPRTVLNDQ
jgi:hypothetical protein